MSERQAALTALSPGHHAIAEAIALGPLTVAEMIEADPDRIDEGAYKDLKRLADRGLAEQIDGKRWHLTATGRGAMLAARAVALLADEGRRDTLPMVNFRRAIGELWEGR